MAISKRQLHVALAVVAVVVVIAIVVYYVRQRKGEGFMVELESTSQLTQSQVPGCMMLTQQGETMPCRA